MIQSKFSNKVHNLDHYIIFIDDKLNLPENMGGLDKTLIDQICNILKLHKETLSKFGSSKNLSFLNNNGHNIDITIISIGSKGELSDQQKEDLGGKIYKISQNFKTISVLPLKENDVKHLVFGFELATYCFDKYKTKKDERRKLESATWIVIDPKKGKDEFQDLRIMQDAIFWTKDLVNEVPNVLTTEQYTKTIINKLTPLGVEIEVLEEEEMRSLGMNALLGVGQGSINKPKLVVMRYNNLKQLDKKPVALVGKGVTFDTGGISLKPADKMHFMKYDMAGSAAVVGSVAALAMLNAKVDVVAAVAIVENMPGSKAQRPGDVVTTMSGQTIEVLNTDAEGRLILADALWYVQDRFKPEAIIDVATLTGAIVVSLGSTFAGCFSNNDELANKLIKLGQEVNELLWRMPLHEDFAKMIESDVADIANIGLPRGAGSATAAHLLEKFVNEIPWAHLDIAGVAWEHYGKDTCPKGATAYGVKLLSKFVQAHYA